MIRVAIHQPHYLPWLPYFDKADQVDVFVFLDTAQYQKNGLQNRNRIKSANDDPWLTVPTHGRLEHSIRETAVRNNGWNRKHARTVRHHYGRAPAVDLFTQELEPILISGWRVLSDLNVALTRRMFAMLGIRCETVLASELDVSGRSQDRILSICRALSADVYLSGEGAAAYQDPSAFAEAGIELRYQRYKAASYPQLHTARGFVPGLSALDLLLNAGPEAGRILRSGRLPSEMA